MGQSCCLPVQSLWQGCQMFAQEASQSGSHGTAALFEKRHVGSLTEIDNGVEGRT